MFIPRRIRAIAMKRLEKNKHDSGQSTIEFLFSFILVLGFVFAFLRVAMVYTNGYLVHYATFQASRAYMVGESNSGTPDGSEGIARKEARKVFDSFKLDVLMPRFDGNLLFEEASRHRNLATNLYVGARVEFSESLMVPGTSAKIAVPMISESYLGMEPTRGECFEQVCRSLEEIGGAGCVKHATVFDNGC